MGDGVGLNGKWSKGEAWAMAKANDDDASESNEKPGQKNDDERGFHYSS